MANVGGTGINEFVGEKRKLVLRGNKLVVVDGRLILGPCDISHGGEMPMTESLFIRFDGKLYMGFGMFVSLGGYAREHVRVGSDSAWEYSDIYHVGGSVHSQGASFIVRFRRGKKTTDQAWIEQGSGTSIVAYSCRLAYDSSGNEFISKFLSWRDVTYSYFPAGGDPIELPLWESYDGPTASFEMIRYRMGTLRRNPDNSIYFEEE